MPMSTLLLHKDIIYNDKGLACMQINVPVLDELKQNKIPVLQWNMDKDSKQILPANETKFKS
jgi:hypothetical protein